MALTVQLQKANGDVVDRVDDSHDALAGLLPAPDAADFVLLRYVDRYGDTVFNRPQMAPFLDEWRRLRANVHATQEMRVLKDVEVLARRCEAEPHLYLRFIGD